MGSCESRPDLGDGTSFQRGEQYFDLTKDKNPNNNPFSNIYIFP